MKKKHLFIGFLALLTISCSQENSFFPDVETMPCKKTISINNADYHVTLNMIQKFLKMREKLDRVEMIQPIIEDGDTLAFYVRFNQGWELISGDKRVPPILARADEGELNWTDTINPGVNSIRDILNIVRESKLKYNQPLNDLWKFLVPAQSRALQGVSSNKDKNSVSNLRGEGQGKWICVDTIYVENTTNSTKLIQTHWAQDGLLHEYKQYTPYKFNGTTLQHTKVGCVAVAAGQAINYMKSKKSSDSDSIPFAAYMPYVEDGILSVSSYTNNWGLLNQTDYAAKFLSYLGKKINMHYGLNESSSTTEKIRDLLDDYHISYQSHFSSTSNQYDYSTVYANLLSGNPVIIAARDMTNDEGHSFIIDGYKKLEWYAAVVYMWDPYYELTEWDVVFGDPTLLVGPVGEGGKEVEGDYSTYVHREVITSMGFDIYFSMNWGWGNYSHEDNYYHLVYSSINNQMPFTYNPNWYAAGHHYNYVRGMIYNLQNY